MQEADQAHDKLYKNGLHHLFDCAFSEGHDAKDKYCKATNAIEWLYTIFQSKVVFRLKPVVPYCSNTEGLFNVGIIESNG